MPVPGRMFGTEYGPCAEQRVGALAANTAASTVVMSTLNNGWAGRFTAPDSRNIKSVWVNWSAVTAAGTVQLRIETVDTTTGKPTGTLYDINAVKSFTPVAGWQNVVFDTAPTTGLTAGTEFAVVLLTTAGGTTMTLRSHAGGSGLPSAALIATDGTTRSNFAEVAGSNSPILTFVMDDNKEEFFACSPWAAVNNNNIFGTNAVAMKFTIPTGVNVLAAGIDSLMSRVGTPAGDLRVRILDSSNTLVAGTSGTISRNSLTNVNGRRLRPSFPAVVTIAPGTYRIAFDSASSANSSNCWRLNSAVARASSNNPSGFSLSTTSDVTATPIVWTDTATELICAGLVVDDITPAMVLHNPSLEGL